MSVTAGDVLDQVAAMLALEASELPPRWTIITTKAVTDAYRDVYAILAGRDLTPLQVAAWTGLESAVAQMALFWSMAQGGPMQGNVPQEDVDRLDIRGWLKTAVLTDSAGKIIKPAPSAGLVGTGSISGGWDDAKKRSTDFNRPGFIDPRTGQLRKW